MNCLKGENEFKSFCAVKTVLDHYYCYIHEMKWEKRGDAYFFTVISNRFVHNMIRILVGTCVDIYEGRLPENQFEMLLKLKDRTKAGRTAPPWGLYLKNVLYKESFV